MEEWGESDKSCGRCYKECLAGSRDDFMLEDKLWLKVNGGVSKGKLCYDCVEIGLGRELTMSDLKDVSVNYKFFDVLKEIPSNHDF
jgi:hypothetical protein|tara:strand:- start:635 stop:892 length:258 start_codon:yes stop_codon:yes gene_type:complete